MLTESVAGLVRSYSMVLFVGRRPLALACLAASLVEPTTGLVGLIGAVTTNVLARAMGVDRTGLAAGLWGLNGLLVGLALGSWFGVGPRVWPLLGLACLAVVVLGAALQHLLGGYFNLPMLSLPFVIAAGLSFAAGAGPLGLTPNPNHLVLWDLNPAWLPGWLREYARALGSVFFQGSILSGLIVLGGLLVTSRLMVLLTLIGFGIGKLLAWGLGVNFASLSPQVWGFNLLLTAVAVGGVFFVPSIRSFIAASLAAALGGLLSLALAAAFTSAPAIILAWPFNLTVLTCLVAARVLKAGTGPAAVDFIPDTPERNLEYHATRLRRYRGFSVPVFHLPLRGRWRVMQGPDGPMTHRDAWRHAWDFVGQSYSGQTFRGDGSQVDHYLVYGQDVLAAAAGRVVRVVDGVPDNPVGLENLNQRWGNLVMVWHTGELYTVYAHLIPGSIAVIEGQLVAQGQLLGRTGNSGRSAVPHLHFHCQRSPEIGAPTTECELIHFIRHQPDGRQQYVFSGTPAADQIVEQPPPSPELSRAFQLSLGRRFKATARADGRVWTEEWTVKADLIAGNFLFDPQTKARLFFSSDGHSFFATDFIGPRRGGLFALYLASSRVPYAFDRSLNWTDLLPPKVLDNPVLRLGVEFSRAFADLVEVRADKRFLSPRKLNRDHWSYGVRTELWLVNRIQNGNGRPRALARTEAWFSPALGPGQITMTRPDGSSLEVSIETPAGGPGR